MKIRVLICACIMGVLLTACGSNENNTEYDELLEEYETLEQEHHDLKRQFEQLVTEKEMMQLMLNAQGNEDKVEIFEEEKKPDTIPGVDFFPLYESASISLSDQAKELLQTSYNDIEAIDEYSDTIYEVGTIFGSRDFSDSILGFGGDFKYAITNVIVGEEALRLQQLAERQMNYDTTNNMLVCFEVCVALDEEYSLNSSTKYRKLCCPLEVFNYNGDDSSKKTCSFHYIYPIYCSDYYININTPKAGKVHVLYQFASIPMETKEFTVFTEYDYINVNVEDWK